MLDLMKLQYREEHEQDDAVRVAIRRLNAAVRYLMNDRKEVQVAKEEVKLAAEYLIEKSGSPDRTKHKLITESIGKMKEVTELES